MSRQQPPAPRGGKYPPGKAIHQDPAAMSDSDEEIEDESEYNLLEAMNDMTKNQRRRVYALKGLLKEYRDLKRKYDDEIAALAVQQLAEDKKSHEERRKIISGEREVTEEEAKTLSEAATKESGVEEVPSSDDEADKKAKKPEEKKKSVTVVTPQDQSGKSELEKAGESATGGIPSFWLTAMKNNEVLEGMVSERDEAALKHLTHIDTSFIDDNFRKGFTLVFHFAANEFFTNETLTKRYLMVQPEEGQAESQDDDDQTLDKIEGCDIDWKSVEKKLTVVIKQKKQRHKSGKGVRVVQREEKCPSFFHFFTAPVEPEDEEEEDEEELPYEDQLEMDYEAGLAVRQNLIPRAVHYYSGKSIDEIAAGFDYPDEDEEDDEEEEEESEEEEVPVVRGGKGGRGGRGGAPAQAPGKGAGKQPDCKQQ